MIDRNERVISGSIAGGTITYTVELSHNMSYSFHGKWAGSPITGLVKLQASNVTVNGGPSTSDSDYQDFADSQIEFDGAGGAMWDVTEARYKWLRLWMQSISGTVTFEGWLTLKRESKIG